DQKNDILSTESLTDNTKGQITFRNVSFTYPDSGTQALNDISFEVEAVKSLAIIGITGSSKSTIANLLMRMYVSFSGQILIDNKDIKAYDIQYLRKQIGYVPQDVFLFSDSITNNIGFGLDEIQEERIIQAAKDAEVYENIINFPNGFETRLGERGITLSGGQKQRVSIARAIAKDPATLLLDDCLSAGDTKTEN